MAKPKSVPGSTSLKASTGERRQTRGSTRQRKQLVVDVSLLKAAMKVTGQNQSETVNEALAKLAEDAAIVDGFEQMLGAFPDHPDHSGAR